MKPSMAVQTRLILVAMYLITVGCGAQTSSPLSGTIHMQSGWKPTVYLIASKHFMELASDYRGIILDSAEVKVDGSFAFGNAGFPSESGLYTMVIQTEGNRFANHLLDSNPMEANYMPIVIREGRTIRLQATSEAFQRSFSIIDPDADNLALQSLRDIRNEAYQKYQQELSGIEYNDTLLLEKESSLKRYLSAMMNFADSTTSLYAALVTIRWISPSGDYERLPEFLRRQCHRWKTQSSDNNLVKELCSMTADELLPVMVGDVMPDFELPQHDGQPSNLHSLLGNKLTIVDIWASWCAPCRKENRDYLAPLYAAYKEKGLEIIAYSIDNDEDAWKKAIAKDQAAWIHSSHLTGDSTPFMEALRITTIPANFILDPNGKVIAKNVYGEELANLVQKLIH